MLVDPLVIFSDLDGTLLDHATYAFDSALPSLRRLRDLAIPVVLCTSKTRAETEPIREALENTHPFIVENGGGVFIPKGYFPFDIDGAEDADGYWLLRLGEPYRDLVAALASASRASGVRVWGFASMTAEDVALTTGLSVDASRRARAREFDEPFMILEPGRAGELVAAIERQGKRWTQGGRFHHILGQNDKAAAIRRLTSLYRRFLGAVQTVGLGDAPNDADFLTAVDIPIVIPSPQVDRVRSLVPNAQVTTREGPAGWNEAISQLLDARVR
jgi:mannosyl-3-phosphoglycerate phosphatase family protein